MNYSFLMLCMGLWVFALGCLEPATASPSISIPQTIKETPKKPAEVTPEPEEVVASAGWNFITHPLSITTGGILSAWGLSKLAYETIPPFKRAVHGKQWYNKGLTFMLKPYDWFKYRNDKKLLKTLYKRGSEEVEVREKGESHYGVYKEFGESGLKQYEQLMDEAGRLWDKHFTENDQECLRRLYSTIRHKSKDEQSLDLNNYIFLSKQINSYEALRFFDEIPDKKRRIYYLKHGKFFSDHTGELTFDELGLNENERIFFNTADQDYFALCLYLNPDITQSQLLEYLEEFYSFSDKEDTWEDWLSDNGLVKVEPESSDSDSDSD